MVTQRYAVICAATNEYGAAVPSSAVDIIIEAESLEAVKQMAPGAVDSALACLAMPPKDDWETRLAGE